MFGFKEFYELFRRDNLLARASKDSHTMLENAHQMFLESVKSLRESDTGEVALDIYEKDQVLNEYQRAVRKKVLKYLAVTGGMNIVPGLILTSIVIDLERIGDYTKNILELALAHPKRLGFGSYREEVDRIESAVMEMFSRMVGITEESDKAAARELIEKNLWIAKLCDKIDDSLIKEKDHSLGPGDAVVIALYVRYLKRVAAHLMNILSSVVNPFERIGFREEEAEEA